VGSINQNAVNTTYPIAHRWLRPTVQSAPLTQ